METGSTDGARNMTKVKLRAADEVWHVGQNNVAWGSRLWLFRAPLFYLPGVQQRCSPISGLRLLTLKDHSRCEGRLNSPKTYGDKFQQSNAHIPPSSTTWSGGISHLVRFYQVHKRARREGNLINQKSFRTRLACRSISARCYASTCRAFFYCVCMFLNASTPWTHPGHCIGAVRRAEQHQFIFLLLQ